LDTERHSFGDIARRTAFSFFLFSVVLTALLAVSWFILVPELTRVEIGGSVRGLQELQAYKVDLEGQIVALESQRGSFLLPVDHDLYQKLKQLKDERMKFQELRREIRQVIKELVPGRTDVVILSGFYFDASKNVGEIHGEIVNIGPRSMTVLAQFVEDINNIPVVMNVETSRYTRQEGQKPGSFFSPFTLRITIR
jgi:predicted CopG family antitoxin